MTLSVSADPAIRRLVRKKKITVLRRLLLSATNVKLVLCVSAGHIVYAIVKADILDAILYQSRLVGHKGSTDST